MKGLSETTVRFRMQESLRYDFRVYDHSDRLEPCDRFKGCERTKTLTGRNCERFGEKYTRKVTYIDENDYILHRLSY